MIGFNLQSNVSGRQSDVYDQSMTKSGRQKLTSGGWKLSLKSGKRIFLLFRRIGFFFIVRETINLGQIFYITPYFFASPLGGCLGAGEVGGLTRL